MLKTRLNAAREVSDIFLTLEHDADALAAASFHAVGRFMTIRLEANLPKSAGADAIEKMRAAAHALADARKLYFEAHTDLSKDIDNAGIRAWFGDTDGMCVPNGSLEDVELRIVA